MNKFLFALLVFLPAVLSGQPAPIGTPQVAIFREELSWIDAHQRVTSNTLRTLELGGDFTQRKNLLLKAVADARNAVERTRGQFADTGASARVAEASRVLFDGLRDRYSAVERELMPLEPPGYQPVRDRTFQAFQDHYSAYGIVVSSQSLTFDLETHSSPSDASVSYARTGDPSFRLHNNPTNTTIPNLVFARWTVRVQKAGYRDQEKVHDPFREQNHVLHFDLIKQ